MRYLSSLLPLLAVVLLPLLTGCGASPRVYPVKVSLDPGLRDRNSGIMPSIEVDLIGVTDTDKAKWDAMPVDTYFQPGNELRQFSDRYTMAFTNEKAEAQTVAKSNAVLKKWEEKKTPHMYILASIPMSGPAGPVDPRKVLLPLMSDRWSSDTTIEVVVKPSGVEVITPMKAAK